MPQYVLRKMRKSASRKSKSRKSASRKSRAKASRVMSQIVTKASCPKEIVTTVSRAGRTPGMQN